MCSLLRQGTFLNPDPSPLPPFLEQISPAVIPQDGSVSILVSLVLRMFGNQTCALQLMTFGQWPFSQ